MKRRRLARLPAADAAASAIVVEVDNDTPRSTVAEDTKEVNEVRQQSRLRTIQRERPLVPESVLASTSYDALIEEPDTNREPSVQSEIQEVQTSCCTEKPRATTVSTSARESKRSARDVEQDGYSSYEEEDQYEASSVYGSQTVRKQEDEDDEEEETHDDDSRPSNRSDSSDVPSDRQRTLVTLNDLSKAKPSLTKQLGGDVVDFSPRRQASQLVSLRSDQSNRASVSSRTQVPSLQLNKSVEPQKKPVGASSRKSSMSSVSSSVRTSNRLPRPSRMPEPSTNRTEEEGASSRYSGESATSYRELSARVDQETKQLECGVFTVDEACENESRASSSSVNGALVLQSPRGSVERITSSRGSPRRASASRDLVSC